MTFSCCLTATRYKNLPKEGTYGKRYNKSFRSWSPAVLPVASCTSAKAHQPTSSSLAKRDLTVLGGRGGEISLLTRPGHLTFGRLPSRGRTFLARSRSPAGRVSASAGAPWPAVILQQLVERRRAQRARIFLPRCLNTPCRRLVRVSSPVRLPSGQAPTVAPRMYWGW
jgi:hypothetical protein